MYYELISPILFFNFIIAFLGFFLYWAKVEGDQQLANDCKLFDGDTFGLFSHLCGEQLWESHMDLSIATVLIGMQVFSSMSVFVYTFWFEKPTPEFIYRIMVGIAFPLAFGTIGVIWYEASTEKFKHEDIINYSFTIGPILAIVNAVINLLMLLFMVFESLK
jgi:hypothetical protein